MKKSEKGHGAHHHSHLSGEGILAKHSMKSTTPRKQVLAALSESNKPASVEELFSAIKKGDKKAPDIVTIYRALEAFEKAGIAKSVIFKDKVSRFELASEHGDHCHHAVCEGCGVTEHIDDPEIEKALEVLARKLKKVKFVKDHTLEFFGECTSCHPKHVSKVVKKK